MLSKILVSKEAGKKYLWTSKKLVLGCLCVCIITHNIHYNVVFELNYIALLFNIGRDLISFNRNNCLHTKYIFFFDSEVKHDRFCKI